MKVEFSKKTNTKKPDEIKRGEKKTGYLIVAAELEDLDGRGGGNLGAYKHTHLHSEIIIYQCAITLTTCSCTMWNCLYGFQVGARQVGHLDFSSFVLYVQEVLSILKETHDIKMDKTFWAYISLRRYSVFCLIKDQTSNLSTNIN